MGSPPASFKIEWFCWSDCLFQDISQGHHRFFRWLIALEICMMSRLVNSAKRPFFRVRPFWFSLSYCLKFSGDRKRRNIGIPARFSCFWHNDPVLEKSQGFWSILPLLMPPWAFRAVIGTPQKFLWHYLVLPTYMGRRKRGRATFC